MYYFSLETIIDAFNELKNRIPSKFVGILSILKSIDTDVLLPNVTYRVSDSVIGNWLNDTMFMGETECVSYDSWLYIRFAMDWSNYIADSMFHQRPNLYPLLVFVYKFTAFEAKPSTEELLQRFLLDFHLSKPIVSNWFSQDDFNMTFQAYCENKEAICNALNLSYKTLTFEGTFSVKAKASELSRAPFIQTLYAGMDNMKCMLISRTNLETLYPSNKRSIMRNQNIHIPLQMIYYGAPGTGKSYKIKSLEKGKGIKPVRTTFHPDSDYATFVGAYKPTMIDNNDGRPNRSYSIDELAELLKVAYQSSERKSVGVDSFVLTYAEQIKGIYGEVSIKDLVEKSGLPDGYQAMINDALNLYHYYIKQHSKDTKIAYKYIPQAFLKAYVQAWANYPEPQYLVIEEINRGNCAQIFGDLFQLLDRSATGFSEYPIAADSDISKYLLETFATEDNFAPDESVQAEINELYKEEYPDVMADVRSGELLLLPKNLHILATMNTSDQSLFPIDSAFKRRWDWEYIPIRNANMDWVITASGKEWDWWTFLQCINKKIGSVTDSEDKKLGYFFVKPQDNHTISAETFVSKVVFYLWNDVFKDYGFSDKEFQTAEGTEMTFPMFYETDVEGQQVNEGLVAQFLQNIVGEPLQDNNNEPAIEEITEA
ncbi:MAG: hypothetical protein PUJ69_06155 [Porphyromonas somerae]|uniref:HTH-like domain-containing protein n=1 Tax=Porphyromonas somerae TaxID=322095 RepID=UPI0026F3734E|nr:hypothetical protein [Porphyromonas somerae]MDD7558236.1 hypothetical protein [Porphyromonas somerae]MDY5816213.1 hypothetical protein [Porphyromonas somerae]